MDGEKNPKDSVMIEIYNASELRLKVPYTSEGLKVLRAMVTLFEAELMGEEKIKSEGKVLPKSKVGSGKIRKKSEDKTTSPSTFSPPFSSPKQRIKFKNWGAIATTKSGTLYKEVVDCILGEYKGIIEPSIETISQIMREMYGKELKDASIATYVSQYKRYIRENKLAEQHSRKEYKKDEKDLLPIENVVEIWNLLPSEFTYKQVKAVVPAHIMQTGPRIDTTNFLLKQFLNNPVFECEETSPGMFSKKEKGDEE